MVLHQIHLMELVLLQLANPKFGQPQMLANGLWVQVQQATEEGVI